MHDNIKALQCPQVVARADLATNFLLVMEGEHQVLETEIQKFKLAVNWCVLVLRRNNLMLPQKKSGHGWIMFGNGDYIIVVGQREGRVVVGCDSLCAANFEAKGVSKKSGRQSLCKIGQRVKNKMAKHKPLLDCVPQHHPSLVQTKNTFVEISKDNGVCNLKDLDEAVIHGMVVFRGASRRDTDDDMCEDTFESYPDTDDDMMQ